MRETEWPAVAENMSGWHIWCFTCGTKTTKKKVKAEHLNHDVDWVKDANGDRYSVSRQ